jgi:hypothetical protein
MEKKWSDEEIECREKCHYVSRFCEEQEDGSLKCPVGIRQCIEKYCTGL